jgi:hypothetical protein
LRRFAAACRRRRWPELLCSHPPLLFHLQAIRDHSQIVMGKNTMMRRSIRLYCERTGNDQWLCLLDHMIGNVGIIFTKGDLNEVRLACGWMVAVGSLACCAQGGSGGWAQCRGRDAGPCSSCHSVAHLRCTAFLTTLLLPLPHPHPPSACALQVRKVISEFKVGAPARVGLVAPNDVTIPGGNTGMDPSQTSFFQVRGRASAGTARPGQARKTAAFAYLPVCLGWPRSS